MQDLIILGTGVHAQEMVEIVDRVNAAAATWNLIGYVSKNGDNAGEVFNGLPVLGGLEQIDQRAEACLVPAFGWPVRELPMERVVSLIDPSSVVSRTAKIGRGCVLYPFCFVGLNAVLGDFVFCLSGVCINHDDVIEDGVSLASGAKLAGFVHLEQDVYCGQSCAIRQKLRVGRKSLVGMGAVVVKDVPANVVVAGNPTRIIRDR